MGAACGHSSGVQASEPYRYQAPAQPASPAQAPQVPEASPPSPPAIPAIPAPAPPPAKQPPGDLPARPRAERGSTAGASDTEDAANAPLELLGAAPGVYTLASGRWRVSRRGSVPRRIPELKGATELLAQVGPLGLKSHSDSESLGGSFRSKGRSPHASLRSSRKARDGSSKKRSLLKDFAAFAYVDASASEPEDVEYDAGGGASPRETTDAEGPEEEKSASVERAAEELEVGEETRAAPLRPDESRFVYIAETGCWRRLR